MHLSIGGSWACPPSPIRVRSIKTFDALRSLLRPILDQNRYVNIFVALVHTACLIGWGVVWVQVSASFPNKQVPAVIRDYCTRISLDSRYATATSCHWSDDHERLNHAAATKGVLIPDVKLSGARVPSDPPPLVSKLCYHFCVSDYQVKLFALL